MKALTKTGRDLLQAQRRLALSRRYAEEAEELAGKALMKAKRSRELSDEASELIAPTLLAEIKKLDEKTLERLTSASR